MRSMNYTYLLLVITMVLSGCVSSSSAIAPTSTETLISSPTTFAPFTSTVTPRPTQTAALTPPATLEAEQAKATIKTLLQEPVDCEAPCFWGIVPDKTAFDNAKNIFAHLGLNLKFTTSEGNKKFYGVIYDFEDGLQITPTFTVQDEIVKNLTIYVNPEEQQVGRKREWLTYSPETLITRYGVPSDVKLF